MEAMLTSMVPVDGRVLIIENGVYGERLSRIAEIYHIEHCRLHYDWGEEIQPQDVEKLLSNDISHVALVHHETTTGRLNKLDSIAAVCKSANIPMLLDGVSSFGAEEIQFNEWNLQGCAATANKCLHGIPGTAFVICKRDALQSTAAVQRSLYLDLHTYANQQDSGGTPFTQSVQSFYALEEALTEHQEAGGWQARRENYRGKMSRLRHGLEKLGIRALLPEDDCSCVLTSFHLPAKMDYTGLHDRLKDQGFVIYAGQGGLVKSIFRVSLMGSIADSDINRFLVVLEEIISS